MRLVSDLSVVFSAPGVTAGKTGAEEVDGSSIGSLSIISSSSGSAITAAAAAVDIGGSASISRDEEPAARVMSVSSSSLSRWWDEEGWVWVGFLRVILLRFFLAFTPECDEVVEENNLGVTTMVFESKSSSMSHLCHTHLSGQSFLKSASLSTVSGLN